MSVFWQPIIPAWIVHWTMMQLECRGDDCVGAVVTTWPLTRVNSLCGAFTQHVDLKDFPSYRSVKQCSIKIADFTPTAVILWKQHHDNSPPRKTINNNNWKKCLSHPVYRDTFTTKYLWLRLPVHPFSILIQFLVCLGNQISTFAIWFILWIIQDIYKCNFLDSQAYESVCLIFLSFQEI